MHRHHRCARLCAESQSASQHNSPTNSSRLPPRLRALHGAQTEISFQIRQRSGSKIAHSHLTEIAAHRRIRKHQSSAKNDKRYTSEHVESFLVSSICLVPPIHYFNGHGSLL